jgi:lysophospholipase L1-like esterase
VTTSSFTYDNRTGRGPGRAARAMTAVLPGAAHVWSQVEPYADAWRTHNVTTLDRPGRRWIVRGDSMSQGVGASAYDAGWVGQLAERLASTGYDLQVVNLSATGARVSDVLQQQLPALDLLGSRDDDLVTVMAGSNNLFGSRERRTRLPAAFAELVDRVPPGSVVATLPQPVLRGAAAPVSLLSGCGSLGWGGWWWVPLVIPVVWCGSVPLGRPTPAAGFRPQLAVRRRSSRSRESAATVRERCVRSIRWLLGVEGALTDVGGGFEAPGFGSGVDGGDLGRGEPHRDGDVQPWRPSENNTNYACRKSAAPSRRWFRLMG